MDWYSEHKEFLHIKQTKQSNRKTEKIWSGNWQERKPKRPTNMKWYSTSQVRKMQIKPRRYLFTAIRSSKKSYPLALPGWKRGATEALTQHLWQDQWAQLHWKDRLIYLEKWGVSKVTPLLGSSLEKFPRVFKSRRLVQGAPYKNIHPISGDKSQKLETN